MKQLSVALVLFLAAGAIPLSAQKVEAKPPASAEKNASLNDAAARAATEQLVAKYTLNADQAKQVYAIQQRKQRNMAEIEPLKITDRSLYLAKLESLQKGTLTSLRRVLHTREQLELYQKTQADVRVKRAEKRQELAKAKAAKDDIRAAILDIYEE